MASGRDLQRPQASVDWKHEFENDRRTVNVSFAEDMSNMQFVYMTESPDRNWAEINLGVAAAFPGGVQSFVNYRVTVGHTYLESHAITLGGRLAF